MECDVSENVTGMTQARQHRVAGGRRGVSHKDIWKDPAWQTLTASLISQALSYRGVIASVTVLLWLHHNTCC